MWQRIAVRTLISILIYFYLYYGENGVPPSLAEDYLGLLLTAVLGNFIGASVHYFTSLLSRKFPWQKNIALRLLFNMLLASIISLLLLAIAGYLYLQVFERGTDISIALLIYENLWIKTLIIVFVSLFVYSLVDFTLYSYNEYASAQIQTVALKRKQLELQFEALKSQLSPHYLFNSLNTISSLAYKDAYLAESFIRKLAQTYQYILETNKKKLVSLKEEVSFLQAYLFLLKVRFESAIQVQIDISEEFLESYIPPLSLQMLVENAVKHNMISEEEVLSIQISIQENFILVQNNKTDTPHDIASFQVGIENIVKRYRFFTDKQVSIQDEEHFKVYLPLIVSEKDIQLAS